MRNFLGHNIFRENHPFLLFYTGRHAIHSVGSLEILARNPSRKRTMAKENTPSFDMEALAMMLSSAERERVEISEAMSDVYAQEEFLKLKLLCSKVEALHNPKKDGDCVLNCALENDAWFMSPSVNSRKIKSPMEPYLSCRDADQLRMLLSNLALEKADQLRHSFPSESKKWDEAACTISMPGVVVPEEGFQLLADARGSCVLVPASLLCCSRCPRVIQSWRVLGESDSTALRVVRLRDFAPIPMLSSLETDTSKRKNRQFASYLNGHDRYRPSRTSCQSE